VNMRLQVNCVRCLQHKIQQILRIPTY
jgi:hypothetical protein